MNNKIIKKSISIIIMLAILLNLIPNFTLLNKIVYASSSETKMIAKAKIEDDFNETKIFKIEIYINNVDETGSTLYLKYPSTKMTPCDASGNIVTTATGEQGTSTVKTVITNGETMGFSDNGDDFFVNTETGELYCAFSIGTRNITSEIEMCTIMFKIKDSVQLSDVSNADFNITSVTDDESYYTSIGEIYADTNPDEFIVDEFSFTPPPAEKKVQSLAISGTASEYIVGDELDLANVKVTKTYNDTPTTTEEVALNSILSDTTNYAVKIVNGANETTLTADTRLKLGDNLKVSYIGTDKVDGLKPVTKDLNVREEKITKIEFQGFNASYKQGDIIDLSTISVIATYEKAETGTKELPSDKYTLSTTGNIIVDNKITLTNAGETVITATLKEDTSKTATKTITIAEKQLIGIEITAPTKDTYTVGEILDLTGLTVTAKYNNNGTETTEAITSGYTTSIANGTPLSTAGVQSITVDYNGQQATFDVVVFPTKLVGTEGENLSTIAVEGFTWDNGNTTIEVGEKEYLLKYTNTETNKVKTCSVKVLGIPANLTATYGQTLADVKYNGASSLPTGFTWDNYSTSVGNVGVQTHTITFAGYTGLTAKVTVAKKTLTKADLTYTMLSGKEYDGQPINDLNVTAPTGAGAVEVKYYKNGETIGSTTAPTNVGTYKVKVSVAEGTNYTALAETELDGSFEITRGKLVAENFDTTIPANKVYDGTAITAATATVKSGIVGAGTTITVKYYKDGDTTGTTTAPTDYGMYTVKVNINEGDNYLAADGTDGKEEIEIGSFSITKKQLTKPDLDFTAPTPNIYDGTEKTATVAIKSSIGGAGTISAIKYYKNGVETNPIDAGEYIVKITTTGATNYENVTDLEVGTFTIEKADPIYTAPTGLTATYGDELSTVTLPAGFTWEESGKVGDAGTRTHTVKYTPITEAEKNNYKEETGIDVNIEVGKANLQAADFELSGMPTGNTKEYDGNPVTVTSKVNTTVAGADDIRNSVTVEYYKDGAKVTDTTGYGTYEVKVSVAEGTNYNAVTGLKVGEFSVTKATLDIAEITVDDPENNTYDGTTKTPTINIPTGAGNAKEIKYYKNGTEVTNPTDAGTYTVKITTENATNYADIETLTEVGTFEIEKANIDPSKINVTPDAEKTYDGNPSTATAALDASVPGATDVTIDVTYVDEDGNTVTNPTDAGTYTIKVSSNGGANYNPLTATAKTETIVINKVTLSADDIQCTLPENLVYDNTSKKATITVEKDLGAGKKLVVNTGDIVVTYVDAEGNTVADPTNAGTYTVKVSVAEGKNYEALAETEITTYTVEKATLTAGDFTVSGIPAGGSKQHDGVAVNVIATQKAHITETLNTEVQYYLSTDTEHALLNAPGGVGTYVVKLKVDEGTNYKAANIEIGTFTITPKGFDPNKINYTNTAEYDGTEKDSSTVNISIDGDAAATITNVKFYQDNTEVTAKNVGTYKVKANITTTESGDVGVIEIGDFTITKKPITVTIQNETIEYGQELTQVRVNDDVAVCTGDNINDIITYELSAKTAGEQTIIGKVQDTEVAKNYNVTFNNGKCTITKKPITVTIGNTSSEYTGTEPTLPATSTLVTIPDGAIVGTDDLGITLTKAIGTDAGDYTITGEASNTNYYVTFTNGTYTIEKATLTSEDFNKDLPTSDVTFGTAVTINPTYKNGITTTDSGTIAVKYYKKEDDGTETLETNPTAVGTYVVKVSVPGGTNYYPADGVGLDKDGNTSEEIKLGEFSIVRSSELPTITITAPTDNTYDKTKKEPTINKPDGIGNATITYYKKEDDGTETPVTEPTDAGTYIVKVATDGGENYGPMTETKVGEFIISPRPVTVTIDNKTSVYGDELKELTSNVTDGTVIAGDDLGITLSKANGTATNTYAITGTASNTNYDVTFEDGTYEITTKPITVTIDDLTSVYGDAIETLTATTTDTLATGDTLEQIVELNTTATTTSNVGTYDITGTVKNNNYTVTYTNANSKGVYTITKADPVCNIAELPATYGNTLADVTLPTRPDGTYTWQDATTTSVGNAGVHTFKVTFTPNDTTNYNTLTDIEVSVNVAKAIPTYTVPTGLEGYEGQPISSIDITSATGFSWTDATTTLPLIKDNGETFNTTMTYTPTDTANYETVENIPVTVTLKANEIKAIRVSSTKADGSNPEYYEGQTFARADILVEAEWAIGGWQTVIDYTIEDETRSLTTSDTEMVIKYATKTANQAITVKADTVTDITITPPAKLDYNYSDAINLTGATITKVWASGLTHTNDTIPMTKDMLSNSDITSFDNMNSLGQKQITVTYGTIVKTNAFQIEVKDVIESISIVDKTILEKDYNYNQPIEVTGGQISINYKSGHTETENITTSMLSGYSMTTVKDNQIVTVTYTDDKGKKYTDTFKINVKDAVIGIDITKEPTKKLYKLNEAQSFADLEVTNVMASGNAGTKLTAGEYTITGFDSTVVGEPTITVTKNGTTYTDTFTVKVIDVTTDMYVSNLPTKTNYKYGEGLDLTGGTITVKTEGNTIGTEIPMTNSAVKVTGYNPNKLGNQELTVTYTYTEETETGIETKIKTDKFTVTVEDYETGVKVTPPTKTTYDYGTALDLTGATVSKVWASGKTTDATSIDGGMISGYNATTVGAQTIIVNAFGKDNVGNFTVNVVDKTIGISMKEQPNKTEYTQGEAIDVTGAVLNVTKQSGIKEVAITKEMISGYDPNRIGTQVITVTYDGKQTQFAINVKEAPKKPTTPTKPTKPTTPTRPNKPNRPVTPNRPTTPEIAKYKVTFVDYDGTVLKEEEVESGKAATAPEVEKRDGYKFKGWDKLFDEVKEDITIKAQYEKIERAKVNGNVTVEQGEDPDLSDVTITIFDEDGEELDEIPVTLDMISGFNPEKIGTQIVTVTYVGEDGFEYTDTLKIRVVRPTETLGVKDEFKETKKEDMPFLPVVAGVSGATGLLLILLALVSKKNVQIYALTENGRKLVGKQKISKNKTRIVLDEYEKQLQNANIEIVLNKKITKKLDDEIISVVNNGKKATYKVQYINNEEFTIRIKNVD